MTSDITLNPAVRSQLLALRHTAQLIAGAETRLTTGRRINGPADNPGAWMQARELTARAETQSSVRDEIDQARTALVAALDGVAAVQTLVEQMKSLALQAKASGSGSERAALATQFNDLRTQIDALLNDATYNGTTVVGDGAGSITIRISDDGSKTHTVQGVDLTTDSAAADIDAPTASWVTSIQIDASIADVDAALSAYKLQAQIIGSDAAYLQTRIDFLDDISDTLRGGADKLTLSDPNEDAMQLTSLELRYDLAVQALRQSSQREQRIFNLFV
ncbi:MAG: flagellin [Alphaproteobacteria bacterium]